MGDVAVDVLIDYLKEADWKKRVMVVETLGKMGNAKAVAPLIDLLRDDYVEVRKNSLMALGMIGDSKAIEPIQHLATIDGNPDIKRYCKGCVRKAIERKGKQAAIYRRRERINRNCYRVKGEGK